MAAATLLHGSGRAAAPPARDMPPSAPRMPALPPQARAARRPQPRQHSACQAAAAEAAPRVEAAAAAGDPLGGGPGPSELATQRVLDWPRLCHFVAGFASTSLGRQEVLALQVARSQQEVERLQADTLAADLLEARYAASIDFGGISTTQAAAAIRRAKKGGALTATQLQAVAGLPAGATRLQKAITSAAKQAGELRPGTPLQPMLTAIKGITEHKALEVAVNRAIAEGGVVREEASEDVARTRGKVRGIEARLRNALKGMPGELSEQGNRLCLAVPGGDTPPRGVLLGSSPGGAIVYVEPTAAVGLNNELAAARGEAFAAEEAVLWRLTGLVMDAADALQHVLDVVVWLDTVFAKARYGRWVEAVYPEFRPFPRNHAPREKGGKSRASAVDPSGEDWIYLRRLRHPLLLGTYLEQRGEQEPAPRLSQARGISLRQLGNRKENMQAAAGTPAAEEQEGGQKQAAAQPPVPIDVCVRPDVRAVIITGPNTGGKTAALKAVGLAVLMARAGLPVPAAHPAVLPPFSGVLADIGDEQSLASSLSTFSGHLRRIQGIRREADGKSLVLLDEVGTGTDPAQGAALGIALLRTLVRGGARGAGFVMATTHHSALTGLKYDDARFENASVEFDEVRLVPTHRLLWGIPGRSNALNTAARIGLRPEIVQAARQRLGTAQNKVEATIAQLETLRAQQEEAEEKTAAAQREARKLERELAAARAQLGEQEASLQLRKAAAQLAAAEAGQEQLRQLQKQQRRQQRSAAQAQQAAAAAAQKEEQQRQREARRRSQPLRPGQTVFVPKLKGRGKIVGISGDEATVQLGLLRVASKLKDLTPA